MNSETRANLMKQKRTNRRNGAKGSVFKSTTLKPVHEIVNVSMSSSTLSNINRCRKLLKEYADKHSVKDPIIVSKKSSDLLVNLLSEYCKHETDQPMSRSTMDSTIQGLRHVYTEAGHEGNWLIDSEGRACGNPLNENKSIKNLCISHRVRIAQLGNAPMKARPLTASIVCSLAEYYWFLGKYVNSNQPDPRDIMLHAILVTGLNIGLRFDETQKLNIENVSVDGGAIQLCILCTIKNSTIPRNYTLREWPGNSALRNSIYMDPHTALLSWMIERGDKPGPIFCDIQVKENMYIKNQQKAWTSDSFRTFLQDRLKSIGIGDSDCTWYTGHSMKRGSVQLYRSLNVRDDYISKEIIQMKGWNAYANYCSAYNDCAPSSLPQFSSRSDMIKHATQIGNEPSSEQIQNPKDFSEFIEKFT